jgi:hypothetical protein
MSHPKHSQLDPVNVRIVHQQVLHQVEHPSDEEAESASEETVIYDIALLFNADDDHLPVRFPTRFTV